MKENNIEENNKYRQGRSRKQYESSAIGATLSVGGLVLFFITIFLYRLIIFLA
jgi:hypothetical protein